MLRNSGFRQSWPEPVDVLLHGTTSLKSSARNGETGCSVSSPRSRTPSMSPKPDANKEKRSSSSDVSRSTTPKPNDSDEERPSSSTVPRSIRLNPIDREEERPSSSAASRSTSLKRSDSEEERSPSASVSRATSPRSSDSIEMRPSLSTVSRSTSPRPIDSKEERSPSRSVSPRMNPKPENSEEERSSLRSVSSATSVRPSDSNNEILCSVSSPRSLPSPTSLGLKNSDEERICPAPSPGSAPPSISPRPSDSNDETVCSVSSSTSVPSSVSPALGTVKQAIVYPGGTLGTPSSIRLLKIHKEDHQKTRIACTLQSVDLAEAPRYRALSYTWGPALKAIRPEHESSSSPDEDQQILCNDQPYSIPQNLQDALLELRQSGFTDWLWVDAICIDRSNTEERARQVSIVGQIYTSAIETVAWLGKDESGVDDVKWGINVMIPKLLQRGPAFWDSRPLTNPELGAIFGVEDLNRRITGIRTFLATRRWFDRAWVAQEVALAPAVCVLVGQRHFSWTDLTNLSIVLARISWVHELVPKSPALNKSYSSAKTFLENVQVLRNLIPRQVADHASLPAPELHEAYRFLEARYGTKTELEVAAAWIAYLLSLVRHMESTERHDKIYSIMGMAKFFSSKIDELVVPDYDQPIESVYTSVTAALLLNSRYLSILAHVGDTSNNQLTNIPSWVIDYSSTNATNPILEFGKGQATHFDASLTSELAPFPRKIEGTRLTLEGAKFDHITMVSPDTLSEVIEDPHHFEEFLKFIGHLPDRYLDGQPRTEILWRAMMMDSEETARSINHPPPSSFAKGFQAWIINLIGQWVADVVQRGMEVDAASESARQFFAQLYSDTQIEVPEEAQGDAEAFTLYHRKRMLPFVRSIEAKVYGRKLFQTGNNLVGMGSCSIQADDQVWLIRDSRTPLILRPKSGTQDFVLVGEAYLHGFMHGEMLDSRWDLGKRIGPVTIV